MPVTPPLAAAVLLPNLVAVSLAGVGVPKLARGLAIGLSTWTQKISLQTKDAGAVGVGKGVPLPVTLPIPLLVVNLVKGFTSQGILGLMSPIFITGLANGLAQTYTMALTNTVHPNVGVGVGALQFKAPPAFPDIKLGFDSAGMKGEGSTKLAKAIGEGLDSTFRALVLPQPIVGAPGPSPSAGVGFGKII